MKYSRNPVEMKVTFKTFSSLRFQWEGNKDLTLFSGGTSEKFYSKCAQVQIHYFSSQWDIAVYVKVKLNYSQFSLFLKFLGIL